MSSDLAPERGFEPRTLRLTDRCCPFRNGGANSRRAAGYHLFSQFFADVAVLLPSALFTKEADLPGVPRQQGPGWRGGEDQAQPGCGLHLALRARLQSYG